jgi:hypothetical protein
MDEQVAHLNGDIGYNGNQLHTIQNGCEDYGDDDFIKRRSADKEDRIISAHSTNMSPVR